jgi:hypothetical protein
MTSTTCAPNLLIMKHWATHTHTQPRLADKSGGFIMTRGAIDFEARVSIVISAQAFYAFAFAHIRVAVALSTREVCGHGPPKDENL